ncbi:MAG: sulfotransferase family protein [Rhodanobacteraceae bacterium]|nr:MAG: sulfotransferase family protein [Rhodanobacteraceae bacterium]
MITVPNGPRDARGDGESARDLMDRGNRLAQTGGLVDALDCYRRVLSILPESFDAHANLGGVLVVLGRFAEAEPHLRWAIARSPEQAPLHEALGLACAEQGRPAEAEACLRRAAELAPGNPDIPRHLGKALYRLCRYNEAEAQYRRALALAPDSPEALADLADLLRREKRFGDAETLYRRALALQPKQAAALYGMGHCLAEAGRVAEACDHLERAIASRPDYIDAYYRLTLLGRPDATGAWLARLEALAQRLATLPTQQQVHYWFALGKLREDARRYNDAFAAYAAGNRAERDAHHLDEYAARQEPLDERFNQRIAATFTADMLRAAPQVRKHDARVPIFIVGMPRSGTTLVEAILAAHPSVHAGGEMRYLPETLKAAFGFDDPGDHTAYPEVVPALTQDALWKLGAAYLDRVWRQAPGASHITDKLTGNYLHAGMIRLALPQAKIVHVVRDPLDACFSCFANVFERGSVPYTYELGTLGRYCARYLELMRHWRRVLPADAVLDVRYEELVADPDAQIRRLLGYVGLPWDPKCLAFHANRHAVRTVSLGQVRRPIYRSSVARWEHFQTHLGPLIAILSGYR